MKIVSSIFSIAAALLVACSGTSAIDVGDSIPEGLTLHHGFPPKSISLDERFMGRNVLLVGLPGAFTPT